MRQASGGDARGTATISGRSPHPEGDYGPARRAELIEEIVNAPVALRDAVAGLTAAQLETQYRNWSIRQIVHHIADSMPFTPVGSRCCVR